MKLRLGTSLPLACLMFSGGCSVLHHNPAPLPVQLVQTGGQFAEPGSIEITDAGLTLRQAVNQSIRPWLKETNASVLVPGLLSVNGTPEEQEGLSATDLPDVRFVESAIESFAAQISEAQEEEEETLDEEGWKDLLAPLGRSVVSGDSDPEGKAQRRRMLVTELLAANVALLQDSEKTEARRQLSAVIELIRNGTKDQSQLATARRRLERTALELDAGMDFSNEVVDEALRELAEKLVSDLDLVDISSEFVEQCLVHILKSQRALFQDRSQRTDDWDSLIEVVASLKSQPLPPARADKPRQQTSSMLLASSATSSRPAVYSDIAVILTRKSGRRCIAPLWLVEQHSAGDVWLRDRDLVELVHFGVTAVGAREGVFGISGDGDVLVQGTSNGPERRPARGTTLKGLASELTPRYENLIDIMIVRNISGDGHIEEYLIPRVTETFDSVARAQRPWIDRITLATGDIVSYQNLQLTELVQDGQLRAQAKFAGETQQPRHMLQPILDCKQSFRSSVASLADCVPDLLP